MSTATGLVALGGKPLLLIASMAGTNPAPRLIAQRFDPNRKLGSVGHPRRRPPVAESPKTYFFVFLRAPRHRVPDACTIKTVASFNSTVPGRTGAIAEIAATAD